MGQWLSYIVQATKETAFCCIGPKWVFITIKRARIGRHEILTYKDVFMLENVPNFTHNEKE